MSDADVELVRNLQAPPEADLRDVFFRGDDDGAAAAAEALAGLFTDDFVCVFHGLSSDERPGVLGLRGAWLDWLEPWETYRAEIDEVRDAGDGRVLVFSRDFGKRRDLASEVELKGSAIWTVRDGRIARAEFFTERADALGIRAPLPAASSAPTGRFRTRTPVA